MSAVLSEETEGTADRLIARYPQARSALLPLLYLVQAEHGYISDEGIAFCARKLGLTRAEVQAVATFYEMFEREDPGDWLLTACVNFSCKVRGGERIFARWVEQLGGHHDREHGVTVKHLECLGNCEGAPVVQVNYQNYERVTPERAAELLATCQQGSPPPSVSGEVPDRFREVCRRLSGAEDEHRLHAAAVRAAQADAVSYERPPADRIGEETIDIGAPGAARPGPDVGDTRGVEPVTTHDSEDPAAQPPAGERLDRPARPPDEGSGGEDASPPAEEAPESDEQGGDQDTPPEEADQPAAADEGTDDRPQVPPAVISQSGGTSQVRRLDARPGRDEVHGGADPSTQPTPPRARPDAGRDDPGSDDGRPDDAGTS